MTPPAPPISRAESNVRLMSLIVIASAREGWLEAAASISIRWAPSSQEKITSSETRI
jgi:hypothetical protein